MQMLTKFESKSSRAKGIAFHPKRPWILTSLHNGTIQLWDYRMGTLIDRFEEHDGPVRGISFHPSQPIFASGGDDYKIRVWNYKTRRCLFVLNGHLDYVRTVFFHHEYPWILSCSDDQTIRIWNWQSRQCIAILTGHNHYVMCAQFHPKEDLIVSASLDQTVRVWDISNIRKKNAAPTSALSFEDQITRASASLQQNDIYGNMDVVVKYVLEGHDRGVNWVSFHPTLPLIVSAGDDRMVKLWRMSETKAWEVDTCRGHFNNVSAVLFHPRQDIILSVGEDKTLRVWDANKRTGIQNFRRENDRFWVICAHPTINLFAAGHDNGVLVFKLNRERPASAVYQNTVYYVNKEKFVVSYDMHTETQSPRLLSLQKFGSLWTQPTTLYYNPAERAVLVAGDAENGLYDIVKLPRENSAFLTAGMPKTQRSQAIFVARNRYATFDKSKQILEIKDLNHSSTKNIELKNKITGGDVKYLHYAGAGSLLLCTATSVAMLDIQQDKVIKEIEVSGVKYIVWNADGSNAALLGKHSIRIINKNMEVITFLHETIRVKSATWDDSGVLIYSTLNHIKYALTTGDSSIIKTLDQTVYLLKVKGNSVVCLTRDAEPLTIDIDPTEYKFKLALIKKDYDEILQIIRTSTLVGQSIIAYLQSKGYPEVALQFVQDPETRFELAIECGNIDVSVEMAKKLDRPEVWAKLVQEALRQGNHPIVEFGYQKLHNFDKLSFLYFVLGEKGKLAKMGSIAEKRGDYKAEFQNSLMSGITEPRVRMFREINQGALAYMTAKSSGDDDLALEILNSSGLTKDQIKVPNLSKGTLHPPTALVPSYSQVWPLKPSQQSFFETALLQQVENMTLEEPATANGYNDKREMENGVEESSDIIDLSDAAEENGGAGWDDEAFEVEEEDKHDEELLGDMIAEQAGAPATEADLWIRNSPVPANHIAAGSFDTAMQLLHRQIGVVNFAPLKDLFLSLYQSSRGFLPANPSLPALEVFLRDDYQETSTRKLLPSAPYKFFAFMEPKMQEAYRLVKANKLEDAILKFKSALHSILFVAAENEQEVAQLEDMIASCREYIVGLTCELERRILDDSNAENHKRILELAAYFAHAKLNKDHQQLAFTSAMKLAYKYKNYSLASHFAYKLLELVSTGTLSDQAKRIVAAGNRNPRDTIEIDYDQFAAFDVCARSLVAIYHGSPSEKCKYSGAIFLPEYKGTICNVTDITLVGATGTGLRLK